MSHLRSSLPVAAAFVLATTQGCASSVDPAAPEPSVAEYTALRDVSVAPPAVKAAADAVVRITTSGSRGTGSFISPDGRLLTNNHVLGTDVCAREGCFVELALRYQRGATDWKSVQVFAEPLWIDPGLDVAILRVFELDEHGKKAGRLATPSYLELERQDAAALAGTKVHVVGHPNGRLKKWSTGDVVDTSGRWFQSTAFSLPGCSGAPILNDDGRIVGILHRGSSDDGLVTRSGLNDVSVSTASASVLDLLARGDAPEARGIGLTRAVLAETTVAEVVEHAEVYANAHTVDVSIGGMPRKIADVLGDACDEGLKNDSIRSLEELEESHVACGLATTWIACDFGEEGKEAVGEFRSCPEPAARDAWRARFQRVFDRNRAFNGAHALSWITSRPGALLDTPAAATADGKERLRAYVESAKPPLDFDLAAYLLRYDLRTYDGVDVEAYVRRYATSPHYALSAYSIVSGLLSLNRNGRLPVTETRSVISTLLGDPKLGLGARLYVEEIAFVSEIVK